MLLPRGFGALGFRGLGFSLNWDNGKRKWELRHYNGGYIGDKLGQWKGKRKLLFKVEGVSFLTCRTC